MDSFQEKPCTDPEILRRLSYIKYLFQIALDQSSKPEPLGSFSILTFHDSVEMFLQLSAEYLGAKKSENIQFIKYWDVINAKLPVKQELSHQREMDKFNRARINLKHYGNLIPKDDIQGHKIVVTNFFQINTHTIFGLEFESISLLHAISSKKVKDILSEAIEFVSSNKKRDALVKIAYAYEILFREYNANHEPSSHFRMRPDDILHMSIGDKIDYSVSRKLYNLANAVIQSEVKIHEINLNINLLRLGIDTEKHTKFKKLTPHINIFTDWKYEPYFTRRADLEDHEIQFCFDYVIECALLFQSRLDKS